MYIYILIAIVAIIIVFTLVVFNKLVTLSNKLKEAFSTMDVYLKKRWDLIPNLVETVKGYAKHEQETLESIINLRNGSYNDISDNDKQNVNNEVSGNITKLMMLAESYPDLKANKNFLDLSNQLTKVEDEIANSRKYYNAVVMKYNVAVQKFPDNLIASVFGYHTENMFEIELSQRENVKVEL